MLIGTNTAMEPDEVNKSNEEQCPSVRPGPKDHQVIAIQTDMIPSPSST